MEGSILRKEKHKVSFWFFTCRVLSPASAASFRKLVFKTDHEKGACEDLLLQAFSYCHILPRTSGTAKGGCHFSCQPLPFLTALTALVHLFLALALSKVHRKVSVSSPCTVVSSCCQSSGWLLRKQPRFVIQSLNLSMIPPLTPAFKDQALSLSASCLHFTVCTKSLSARLAISLLLVYKRCYKSRKEVVGYFLPLPSGDNAGTWLKPEGHWCRRQWERWFVQIQKQVGL